MAKHTQTIRRQIVNELFECVWPFCEMVKGLSKDEACNYIKKEIPTHVFSC